MKLIAGCIHLGISAVDERLSTESELKHLNNLFIFRFLTFVFFER